MPAVLCETVAPENIEMLAFIPLIPPACLACVAPEMTRFCSSNSQKQNDGSGNVDYTFAARNKWAWSSQ